MVRWTEERWVLASSRTSSCGDGHFDGERASVAVGQLAEVEHGGVEGDGGGQVRRGEDVEQRDFKGTNAGAVVREARRSSRRGMRTTRFLRSGLNDDGTELAVVILDGGGVGSLRSRW